MTESTASGTTTTLHTRDPRDLIQIFEIAEDLPTLPEVAFRLQEVVNDPKSSAKDVAQIIEEDPAIATKVLRMVNSVFYSPARGQEITQLQPAITRLGFVTVTNIALSTSIFNAFSKAEKPIFDRKEFWKHSVCVGIVTTVLQCACREKLSQPITRDLAHLAGIIHDMGKILFERYANIEFHQALQSAQSQDIPAVKEEARFIGMGHDQAGAWLSEKWKLGPGLGDVIMWHHDPLGCPEPQCQDLIKLVHMADYICHQQELGHSGNPSAGYDDRVSESLGLTQEKIESLMPRVLEEAEKSVILVSLAD